MKTITLRLSEDAYDAVKAYAEAEHQSMNAWIERVLDGEDMRRRCASHEQWMASNPDAVAFAQAWGDQNLTELAKR